MSTILRTVVLATEDDGISDIELSGTLNIGNTEDSGVGVDKGQSSISETLLKALFSR